MKERLGYRPSLNGLRGIAILSVVGDHYFRWPRGGFYGVDLFFALSGFLITTLLLEERDRTGRISLRDFYVRRARRLFPALFVLLAVLAVVTVPEHPLGGLAQLAAGGLYVGNFTMAYHYPWLHVPLGQCWSLAEEEQFYLLWPVVLIFLLGVRRMRESRIAVALSALFAALMVERLVLASTGTPLRILYYRPDTHADALILGCAFALLRRRGGRLPQAAGWSALLFFLVAAFAGGSGKQPFVYWVAPVSLASTALVGAALESGWLPRLLSVRPLVWVGEISYSLYLWHLFVGWGIWQAFGSVLYGRLNLTLLAVLELPIAFGLAALSYYKVERPLRRSPRLRVVQAADGDRRPVVVAVEGGVAIDHA